MDTKPFQLLTAALVACLLSTALVAAAQEDGEEEENGNAAANDNGARGKSLAEARRAAIASFQENRTAILEEYRATLTAVRESYLENKTAVIDACRAEDPQWDENTTGEEKLAYAHCVRDGLEPLKEEVRAAFKDARDKAKADLLGVRQAVMDAFRAAKAAHRGA